MPQQLASITHRLNRLLDALESGDHPGRAQLEDTLTDGYAWALKLDAECARLERSIGTLAAQLGDGDPASARELARAARRLAGAKRELVDLRSLLASLRAEAAEPKVA